MRVILFIILSLFFVWQVMAASLSDTYLTKVKHGIYSSATQAQLNNIYGHTTSSGNPHGTTPPQVFGNPTGARYPKFMGNDIWQWERPLELCGTNPDTAVYDGAPALSCAIDSGVAAFTYDVLGQNPLPAMLPYTVKLYEVGLNNNEPVTADSIAWTVPASNSLLFGNATTPTFTPTIFGTYSANKTNWIKATVVKGWKTCIALLPVSVTKEGAQGATGNPAALGTITATTLEYGEPATAVYSGSSTARNLVLGIPKGQPGESAIVTKASVVAVFTVDALSGGTFILRPYTGSGETDATVLISLHDYQGFKRWAATATRQTNYHSDGVTKTGFENYSGTVTIW